MDGRAFLYRREVGGNFYVELWVPSAKRQIKRSLRTTNEEAARSKAVEFVLEKLATEKAGLNVFSGSIADLINAWESKQLERMARGEVRSARRIRQKTAVWRKQLAAVYGPIDQVLLSSMSQDKWELYIGHRGREVKLSTLKGELDDYTALVRNFGMERGCPVIPDFSRVRVPKQQRSRREETLSTDEFKQLTKQLLIYGQPNKDGKYERSWSLRGPKYPSSGKFNQDDEWLRRRQLELLVRILAASGLRPGELAGSSNGSLRWQDVSETDVVIERKLQTDGCIEIKGNDRALILNVRDETKTGRRIVPAMVGFLVDELRDLNPTFTRPQDPLFCDFKGRPVPLNHFRLHFQDVIEQWGFDRFHLTFYTLRHFFCTEALKRGVSTTLVARALGTSVHHVESTYSHILMQDEQMIRQLYASS